MKVLKTNSNPSFCKASLWQGSSPAVQPWCWASKKLFLNTLTNKRSPNFWQRQSFAPSPGSSPYRVACIIALFWRKKGMCVLGAMVLRVFWAMGITHHTWNQNLSNKVVCWLRKSFRQQLAATTMLVWHKTGNCIHGEGQTLDNLAFQSNLCSLMPWVLSHYSQCRFSGSNPIPKVCTRSL